MNTGHNYEEKVKLFSDALAALRDPEVEAAEKNRLLKRCISRIDYSREKPERIKSKQVRYYDKEQKRSRWKSPLNTGGNWTTPPIELDVKLKVWCSVTLFTSIMDEQMNWHTHDGGKRTQRNTAKNGGVLLVYTCYFSVNLECGSAVFDLCFQHRPIHCGIAII